MTPQSSNRVLTFLGNSGLCWTVFARNRDTAVPAEGNDDLQTLICVLVARPRRCLTLLNPIPWQNWMAAYLGYTLRMKTLFHGWPVMVHDTHTRREEYDWATESGIYVIIWESCWWSERNEIIAVLCVVGGSKLAEISWQWSGWSGIYRLP